MGPEAIPGDRQESKGRPRGSVRWSVAAAGIGVTAVGVLPPFMTAALSVQIRGDLDIGVGAIGVLVGLYFAVAALTSAPLGKMIQSRGWARGIVVSGVLSAVSLAGMAVLARSVWTILPVFIVGGVASAISHPAANLALAGSVPRERQGLIFGIKHTAVPAAAMLAGLAVPGFGLTIGWRWAFLSAALLALAVPAAVACIDPVLASPAVRERDSRTPRTPTPLLVMMAVAAMLGIGAMDALAAFVVPYAVDVGIANASAGILLAVGSALGLSTRVLVGWLVDRRQAAGLPALGGLMVGGGVGLAVLAAGGRASIVIGALLAFAVGWGWSGLMTFVVVRVNTESAAAATGISHTGTFVGAALGPALVGLIAENVSFATAWWITSAAMAGASLVVLGVWLTGGLDPDERWTAK